jgi:hypothetical protein
MTSSKLTTGIIHYKTDAISGICNHLAEHRDGSEDIAFSVPESMVIDEHGSRDIAVACCNKYLVWHFSKPSEIYACRHNSTNLAAFAKRILGLLRLDSGLLMSVYWCIELVDQLAMQVGARWWLCGGNLLGYKREGGQILYDDDVDLCIAKPDWGRFVSALYDAGLDNHDGMGFYYIDPYWIKLVYNRHHVCDIFMAEERSGAWRFVSPIINHYHSRQFWKESELFPLKRAQYGRVTATVPANCDPYLDRTYGKWRDEIQIQTFVHTNREAAATLGLNKHLAQLCRLPVSVCLAVKPDLESGMGVGTRPTIRHFTSCFPNEFTATIKSPPWRYQPSEWKNVLRASPVSLFYNTSELDDLASAVFEKRDTVTLANEQCDEDGLNILESHGKRVGNDQRFEHRWAFHPFLTVRRGSIWMCINTVPQHVGDFIRGSPRLNRQLQYNSFSFEDVRQINVSWNSAPGVVFETVDGTEYALCMKLISTYRDTIDADVKVSGASRGILVSCRPTNTRRAAFYRSAGVLSN